MIENLFGRGIPVEFSAFPLRACRHDHSYRMCEAVFYRGIGLPPAAQAFEPVPHMGGVAVRNKRHRPVSLLDSAVEQPLRPTHASRASFRKSDQLFAAANK